MPRKDVTVYDEINTFRDKETGEIIDVATKKVVKREKTPEFVMMFTQGLSILTKSELTKAQAQTLFEVLKYTVNNSNMLLINPDTRKLIAKDADLKVGTVNESIKSLAKKEILVREGRTYFLNPILFGRGNWNDIKKLTQSLQIEYDFENNSALEKITTRALYNNEDTLKSIPHEVVETNEHVDEDGALHQEVVIQENPNNQTIDFDIEVVEEQKQISPPVQDAYELDLIKEKNKQKELEIKEMQLKIQMHEMGL